MNDVIKRENDLEEGKMSQEEGAEMFIAFGTVVIWTFLLAGARSGS